MWPEGRTGTETPMSVRRAGRTFRESDCCVRPSAGGGDEIRPASWSLRCPPATFQLHQGMIVIPRRTLLLSVLAGALAVSVAAPAQARVTSSSTTALFYS